jgi:hypothetical protein
VAGDNVLLVPVPLPGPNEANQQPPDAAEVALMSRGFLGVIAPDGGLTQLQRLLLEAIVPAMTGFPFEPGDPLGPDAFARVLARRAEAFRTRIVQLAILGVLVLRPIPPEVTFRVTAFAREASVDDGMLAVARRFSEGSLGLAAFDFQRNGYAGHWGPDDDRALHVSSHLAEAWEPDVDDPALARRWTGLDDLPPGSLGRRVSDFYRARGFAYPGLNGSAPPLLAQHDWVHVLADYGTTVEAELEVFAFIARANDDMRAFSLLAMVVCLFETGYLATGAGLFESDTGHLSRQRVAVRLADAMRRGARCRGSVDFLRTDWFDLADRSVEDVRAHFGVEGKAAQAMAAGSVGPWERGGISPFQWEAGRALAEAGGLAYDPFGASM